MSPPIRHNDEVSGAVADGAAVVALESTIFSNLGLPAPHNVSAMTSVFASIRASGAVPALTAVLDGEVWCGVPESSQGAICGPARKVAKRDLGPAVGRRLEYGATTVSASVAIAAACGVEVFATGGIGGVHRGWSHRRDVSADLGAIAAHQVITVSAGAKSFLDLSATLEELETLSVPVIGWRTDEFPAFYSVNSGLALDAVAESPADVVAMARTHWSMGGGGLLVVNPVPEDFAIDSDLLDEWTAEALRLEGLESADSGANPVTGAAVTPRVLSRLVELSGGRTLEANVALAASNASVAAGLAQALAQSAKR